MDARFMSEFQQAEEAMIQAEQALDRAKQKRYLYARALTVFEGLMENWSKSPNQKVAQLILDRENTQILGSDEVSSKVGDLCYRLGFELVLSENRKLYTLKLK